MKKHVLGLAVIAALFVGGAGAAYAHRASTPMVPLVKVNSPTGTLVTLKTSELAILPQASVTIQVKGSPVVEQGPTLASLLTYAGVQYNSACKNDELRWWIEVTSSDGQSAAALTAGEIDPFFGNRPAILSISSNGNFLTSQGPTLVVPNDGGQRMIKNVAVVTVGRAPAQLASTTPACSPTVAISQTPPVGSVVINGDVANPTTLTFAQLQAMQQTNQNVSFLNGTTPSSNSESGPLLSQVLALAKPKFLACDPNDKLRFYVAVTSGQDGYTALVSWAELDPSINGINQLLSLVENGGSLATVGPRNTVPGDVRGGRYVSGVSVLTVFRAPTEVRIPSCKTAKK
jgi:hypothetical protein